MKQRYLFHFLLACLCVQFCAAQSPYVIPTVFHIIHLGGAENISDNQVLDAVRILNEDFNKRNADTIFVASPFANNIANMGVEFRLANKDPNGNCTNGIEHIYSHQTNMGEVLNSRINAWPRDKYLNIWVINRSPTGAAVFANSPALVDLFPEKDGIQIIHHWLGGIGTSTPYGQRALTYIAGKYFNLLPTSGLTICGDDSVSDTPITSINATCDTGLSFCNPPIVENVQNFMSETFCSRMFTNGQKVRVQTCLNSSVADRNNLWKPSNLNATGTNTVNPSTCAPICDYGVSARFVCIGRPITFSDNSYNGAITSRQWVIPNSTTNISTDSSVTVSFYNSGWQSVSLTVSNGQGSSSKTQSLVYVSNPPAVIPAPYSTGFEDSLEFIQNWTAINDDNDVPRFQYSGNASLNGSSSVKADNFYSHVNRNVDELISPMLDCSTLDNTTAKLSFWYASAKKPVNDIEYKDSIIIYASKTCGDSWIKIFPVTGSSGALNAATVTSQYYKPGQASDWRQVQLPIPQAFRATDVRFKIQLWGAHDSNNFYLDDFKIGADATGLNDEAFLSFSVSPNPFKSALQIFGLNDGVYELQLMDIAGKQILKDKQSVDNTFIELKVNENFTAGIYLLRISCNGLSSTVKVVKQ